ncbi:hypothetical protein PsYK624_160090 [Phanerochaete sordida]|uniref:Uncharacterized protein n=1 Tax=Phanerochaete sordida TaxID=48140 RepID=A0A9P3GPZ9_9APHY|nr:hypothetical protein PsYK624_160090 [Phanerochaete sordida]
MADYSTTVVIVNREKSPMLDLIYSYAQNSSWVMDPGYQIRPGESKALILAPRQAATEGRLGYRTFSGTTLNLYFTCTSRGNTVTATPDQLVGILKYNATGTPLVAAIFPAEDPSSTDVMPPHSATLTIRNGYSSPKLTRSSYKNDQGNWITRPRSEIPAQERDIFRLAAIGDVSEGRVVYRLEGGTELEIYFKCSSRDGNVVTATPGDLLAFDYHTWGDLNATGHVLEGAHRGVHH